MSNKILGAEVIEAYRETDEGLADRQVALLLDSHEALRTERDAHKSEYYQAEHRITDLMAERDAAREEAQRWVQIARAALAAAQTQEPTDPVKT